MHSASSMTTDFRHLRRDPFLRILGHVWRDFQISTWKINKNQRLQHGATQEIPFLEKHHWEIRPIWGFDASFSRVCEHKKFGFCTPLWVGAKTCEKMVMWNLVLANTFLAAIDTPANARSVPSTKLSDEKRLSHGVALSATGHYLQLQFQRHDPWTSRYIL